MKGKPWPTQDERLLRNWLSAGTTDLDVLVSNFQGKYSKEGIRQKLNAFGLLKEQYQTKKEPYHSPQLQAPSDLPTVEEAVKILAGAMLKSTEAGLSREEVQRLQVVANLAKTYKEAFADYLDYCELEKRLIELEEKYAKITRSHQTQTSAQNDAT